MKKAIAAALALVLSVAVLSACGKGRYDDATPLEYKTYYRPGEDSDGVYNRNLFYRNDLDTIAADPAVIAVTEGEEAGSYYMYATSDDIGVSGFQCWKSRDLATWEARGVAFLPNRDAWALRDYWAPEVIYDGGKYYMFYSADNRFNGVKSMGLAVSDKPEGPFTQYTDDKVSLGTPLFDFTKMPDDHPLTEKDADGNKIPMKVIDASPFIDPVTGKKYMYFCHDLGGGGSSINYAQSSIYGMEMKEWWEPDYTTVTRLTKVGYLTPDAGTDERLTLSEGNVNEAPFMTREGELYYLTFSANSYTDKSYSVRTAVGTSPLGGFTKLTRDQGGFLLYSERDNASGTGHHSFVKAGDETFIVYHAHTVRDLGGDVPRAIATDRVKMMTNSDGLAVPHANGPSWSLQPLPATVSGYRNLAPEASVSANHGTNAAALTDEFVKYHAETVSEFEAPAGKTVITLAFEDYVTARALMVYNSLDYDKAFDRIESVDFHFKEVQGGADVTGIARTDTLYFDWNSFADPGLNMRPGGSFVVEFAELLTDRITVTIDGNAPAAISEIVVLGKTGGNL